MREKRKIILISMLPGLGKSTIARDVQEAIDYEDWMEERGLKYKTENNAYTHLGSMLEEERDKDQILIVFSSIHWESLGDGKIESNLVISMDKGLYNCEELRLRGRPDICTNHSDKLEKWNDDYDPLKKIRNNYQLQSGKFLDLPLLIRNGYLDSYYEVELEGSKIWKFTKKG